MRARQIAALVIGLFVSVAAPAQTRAEVLKRYGLTPVVTIVARDGKAAGNGFTIRFLGACDLAAKRLRPWGLDGRPLSPGQAKLFWKGLGERSDDKRFHGAFGEDPEGRTFAFSFIIDGPTFLGSLVEDTGKSYLLLEDYGSGLVKGEPRFMGFIVKPLTKGGKFDFRLEAQPGQGKEILRFTEGDQAFPKGFDFIIEERKRLSLMKASKGQTTETPVVRLRVVATVPPELRDMVLDLRAEGPSRKVGPAHLADLGVAMKGELVDKRYAGKELFTLSVPAITNGKRVFVLTAGPRTIVEFRAIPLHPAKQR
jgi:hypothetical protein